MAHARNRPGGATPKQPASVASTRRRRMRLRRSSCSAPGFTRRRSGRGFAYNDPAGQLVRDPELLQRFRDLAIPPAWREVWICPWPNGHLQAVGTDSAGRRQYLYHPEWRRRRDQEKFDSMLAFARALPTIREVTQAQLGQEPAGRGEPTRQQVLACTVRLLDLGLFRIGGEDYAEENGSYGLATLRREHVTVHAGVTVRFDYTAKGGKRRVVSIPDPTVAAVVATLKRRRGGADDDQLFAHRDGDGWQEVRSQDINLYLKEITGGEFTAKDFRTWHATVLAAVGLAVSVPARRSATGCRRAVSRVVQEVAGYLGNTPTVCRNSYIDPRVIDRFHAGATIAPCLPELVDPDPFRADPDMRGVIEAAVLELLDPDAALAEAS
jgi:DNA topoisomerase I